MTEDVITAQCSGPHPQSPETVVALETNLLGVGRGVEQERLPYKLPPLNALESVSMVMSEQQERKQRGEPAGSSLQRSVSPQSYPNSRPPLTAFPGSLPPNNTSSLEKCGEIKISVGKTG